jgi:signal transduction histidine kinase
VAVAFTGRWLADSILSDQAVFALFVVAVLIVAWTGGAGPALAALAASVMLTDYFFLSPRYELGFKGLLQWVLVIGSVLSAVIGILVIESMYRGADQLRRQQMEIEAEVARRRRAEAELDEARRQLQDYALDLEEAVRTRTLEMNEAVGFLENFCYSIAHDLRAPARTIEGFTRLLWESKGLCEEDRAWVERIRQANTHMDTLINDLLEYGNLSHTPLKMGQIDLNKAVREALIPFQALLQRAGATVVVAPDLHSVWSDETLLQSILHELVNNALAHARPEQSLRLNIYSTVRDDLVRLWVCDNGVGIPQEYRQKIFGLFQTLSRPSPHRAGVGLAIVAKAAERMHGAAGVEAGQPVGSSFWVDLPQFSWETPMHPRPDRAFSKEAALSHA